jgi:hypothetical protein
VPAHEDEAFDRTWVRRLLQEGVAALGKEMAMLGRARDFEMFQLHDVEPPRQGPPSYGELAATYGIPHHEVKSALDFMRQNLRRTILALIREYCLSEEEAAAEFGELFPG